MHLCTCLVMIAGDNSQIVAKNIHSPVTWPEIQVLKLIHGEDSVFDIVVLDEEIDRSPQEEMERLKIQYGEGPVKAMFPMPKLMETEAPGHDKKKKDERKNHHKKEAPADHPFDKPAEPKHAEKK